MKTLFNVGDLVQMVEDTHLSTGMKWEGSENFYKGDLLLVAEIDAVIDQSGAFHYHFISAKSGNSIYWGRQELQEHADTKYFEKVKV